MNKERKVTQAITSVVFNGDVSANEVNEVLKEFYGEVIIKGRLLLNESLNLESNLFVEGSIDAEDTVTSINITGNVFAHAINCNHITISEDLYCLDLNKEYIEVGIDSEEICIGGTLYCEGNIIAKKIKVGEGFECNLKNIKSPTLIYIAKTNTNINFQRGSN